jgi:zinc/manganese transport system permease protein
MMHIDLLTIMAPALVVGLMVAFTHAPLGLQVLKRGIIFIDLALAQIAGLGLIIGSLVLDGEQHLLIQAFALAAALAAAFFFYQLEKRAPQHQEAIIGCSFILAASLALLLLSQQPQGNEDIAHLLSGQILFTSWHDISLHAPIYIGILLLWFIWPNLREKVGFYILFAIAITSSVQLVGVYVVFASLILPALAASLSKRPTLIAWLCGFSAVSCGIIIASIFDLPAGPVIVLSYAANALVFYAILSLPHFTVTDKS